MGFEFATATRVIFGAGTLTGIGPIAREFGRCSLVVTGRDATRAAPLLEHLAAAGLSVSQFAVTHEPTVEDITRGIAQARAADCELVIGFGGGAALDTAKAIAATVTNRGALLDYLEVVGLGQPLTRPGLPCIAIPTTAGTGAEVTRNAVLAAPVPRQRDGPARRVKVSLRSPHLLPRVALVDPVLTYDMPPALTAATGLDALTQLIEPYVSSRANPLTDAFCVDGLRRVARSLRTAVEDGHHATAREDMALASLLGGLALANAGLGAVHGFAGPIGGLFSAPHGAVCAALLPHVTTANLAALRARQPSAIALARYDEVARLLTGRPHANAEDGVRWLRDLNADLRIPSLAHYAITSTNFPTIVTASLAASSMKANPIVLTPDELSAILAQAV